MSDFEDGTVAERIGLFDRWLAGTGITSLELRTPSETIRLTRPGEVRPPSETPAPPEPGATIASPGVGVFLHRHPLATEDLARVGGPVRAGDVVGLLQAGALLLHVTSPADGTVAAIAPAGDTVGYGAPLLRLQRSAAR